MIYFNKKGKCRKLLRDCFDWKLFELSHSTCGCHSDCPSANTLVRKLEKIFPHYLVNERNAFADR